MSEFRRLRSVALQDRLRALPGLEVERRTVRDHHPDDGEQCPVCGVSWPCPPVAEVAGRLGVRMAA